MTFRFLTVPLRFGSEAWLVDSRLPRECSRSVRSEMLCLQEKVYLARSRCQKKDYVS